jgi:PAS domain S-box-containing protein
MNEPVRFLLVDDHEPNLISLEALLKRDGLEMLRARNGEQALELLLQHEVALALVDVQMPGMDGFELAQYMRGNERTRHIPIIFLTAGPIDRNRHFQGYEAGAVDFLNKPLDTQVLLSKTQVFYNLAQQRSKLMRSEQRLLEINEQLNLRVEELQEARKRALELMADAVLANESLNNLNAELSKSEAFNKGLMEASPDCVKVLDRDGHLLMMNQQGQCLMEIDDLQPYVGKDWWEMWPEQEQQQVREAVRQAQLGEPSVFEAFCPTAKGTQKWWDVRLNPVKDKDDQGVVRMLSISRDITQRKASERAKAHLAAIVESSDDAIISKDLNGVITSWNHGAEQLFGYTAQEAVGQPVTILMPPDRVNEEPGILERIRRGEKIEHFETIRRCKHGGLLNVSLTISPILDDHGRVTGVSKIARDITRQKEIREKLVEADHQKNRFLATLAHELRNPLTPLRNGLELLGGNLTDPAAQKQVHEMTSRQVDHMVHLIDDLMDLSRINRGMVELRPQELALVPLLQEAADTSRPFIEQSGHQLIVDLPEADMHLQGDPVRLIQVVTNLLNNAAKYTDAGGRIILQGSREGDELAIRVSDNGIGLAKDQLDRVFDMFAQVDSTSPRTQGGLGIGLHIVKHLVELHHGRIGVESPGLGKGSTFIVHLPLTVAKPKQAPKHQGTGKEIAPLRILVADDNVDAALTTAMILRKRGHQVEIAHNGHDALSCGALLRPQFILMDIGMPQMDGNTACRRMRETDWGARAYIAAITGWSQEDDRKRTREAGFDEHLVKPFGSSTLTDVLHRAEKHLRSKPKNGALA